MQDNSTYSFYCLPPAWPPARGSKLLLTANRLRQLTGVYPPEHRDYGQSLEGLRLDESAFVPVKEWLDAYFTGSNNSHDLNIAQAENERTAAVQSILVNKVPYGECITYTQMAILIGQPGGARGVGSTLGRNRLLIVVPCHRIIGQKGQISGYAGGISFKAALLQHELNHRL